jgi:hypothetical protein
VSKTRKNARKKAPKCQKMHPKLKKFLIKSYMQQTLPLVKVQTAESVPVREPAVLSDGKDLQKALGR